jgi:hypothetical protein
MKKICWLIMILILPYSLIAAPPADIQKKRMACIRINHCLVWNRVTDQTKCVPRQVSYGKTVCQKWNSSKYTVFSN